MREGIGRAWVFLWILTAPGLALSAQAPPGGEAAEESWSSKVEAFRKALEKEGFEVEEKRFRKADIVSLCCNGITQSCFGNNASAPYLTFTTNQNGIEVPDLQTLGEQDALVLVGKTPPPVSYFSYRSYLFSRYNPNSPEPDILFLSLGDTVNVLNLKGREAKGTFDRTVIVVSTADRGTDKRVRDAAERAGFARSAVNTDVLPSPLLRMGYGETADRFTILHRLMLPKEGYEEEVGDYMDHPPYTAFRIRRTQPDAKPKPFENPVLTPRGTGTNELDLMPTMDRLRDAILRANPGKVAREYKTGIWINEGMDGLQREANMLGEGRDTTYLSSETFRLASDPSEYLVVYGPLHDLTGKATYSNFSLYGDALKVGLVGMNSPDLKGTARDLLPSDPDAEKFYAFKVARDCGGEPPERCLEIRSSVPCPRLDLDGDLFVAFRAYLEKKTETGPVWTELIYDKVIKFSEP